MSLTDATMSPPRALTRRSARAALSAALAACFLGTSAAGHAPTLAASGRVDSRAAGIARPAGAAGSILFTTMESGDAFGTLASVPLQAPDGERLRTDLRCDRVHFAGGRGLCLWADHTSRTVTYRGAVFDGRLQILATFPLAGPAREARVSPDGRRAAVTIFSPDDEEFEGDLPTRTFLVDLDTGEPVADLKDFEVWRGDERFQPIVADFMGVTWAPDGNHFYASVTTAGHSYLLQGDAGAHQALIVREGVESPSLSPDGTRLVYKQRIDLRTWRLRVLDLATLADRPLGAESRNVDDQVEWVDDTHVVYSLFEPLGLPQFAANLWTAGVDDASPARVFVPAAYSHAIVRDNGYAPPED